MAFQVGTACYGTATQAAQASASSQLGAVVQHGGSAHVVELAALSDSGISYALRPVGGGAPITVTAAYQAQPCNLLGVDDGLALGWSVAGVWLAVYAVVFIARTVWHVGDKDDGNT